MALVAKLSGGKQINRCQKGFYEHRCYGAGLSFQLGPQWHCTTSKAVTCKSPAAVLKRYASKKTAQKANKESLRRKLFEENGHQQHKRKESTVNDSMIHYGPNCQQPDMPPEQYAEKERAVLASLQVNEKQQMKIEKATRGQADNTTWHFERNMRLTASNFYAVCRRREWTPCDALVKTLLYKKNFTSAALERGRQQERVAIRLYEQEMETAVQPCGLFVYPEYGFLAAVPDGLIASDGIVEVKCPFTAKDMEPSEAAKKYNQRSQVHEPPKLSRSHNYFYQVQGQLHITKRSFCHFVVCTSKGIHVQRIERDNDFCQYGAWYFEPSSRQPEWAGQNFRDTTIRPANPSQQPQGLSQQQQQQQPSSRWYSSGQADYGTTSVYGAKGNSPASQLSSPIVEERPALLTPTQKDWSSLPATDGLPQGRGWSYSSPDYGYTRLPSHQLPGLRSPLSSLTQQLNSSHLSGGSPYYGLYGSSALESSSFTQDNLSGRKHSTSFEHEQPVTSATMRPGVDTHATDAVDLVVTLHRQESGFGFRIVGGTEEGSQVSIGHIVPGGAADLDGRLMTGDEIVFVDGQNVLHASHHHVVQLMGAAALNGCVTLGLRRKARSLAHPRFDWDQLAGIVDAKNGKESIGEEVGGNRGPEPPGSGGGGAIDGTGGEYHSVELQRGVRGFGFSIRGGREFHSMPLFVLRIADQGPAQLSGKLQVGDQILEVNGINTKNMTHADAINIIRQGGNTVRLLVKRTRKVPSPLVVESPPSLLHPGMSGLLNGPLSQSSPRSSSQVNSPPQQKDWYNWNMDT
ncbi:hypothetical protein HPB51_022032 [Rhipicephalus microplus]|uniref:PDZ domain-containing protein n=1 Tax=Rhipicephalus microplus TaxID=6941 RepID=A0A9J6DJR0_RHIMP|nr:hypothetical protein HPB51_022032 [Rhipicephalus microplus]